MRSVVVAVLSVGLALSAAVSVPARAQAADAFTDIAGSPFRTDIEWALERGITSGCTATRFCPTATVTREQVASFLDRMFSFSTTSRDYYADDEGSQHEAAINRVAAAGVTGGCAAGRYCPGGVVTREQMASFISRAARLIGGAGLDHFTDDDASPHEADIDRVAEAGITGGCRPGRFCPAGVVTREQMVAFLHRIVDPVASPPGGATVIVGAGDIASCGSRADEATAQLLDSIAGTVFTAGDNVYADGTAAEFQQCYGPSWGRHRARTRPAPGNHDYHVSGATGYYGYFGETAGPSGRGYYAYDVGEWRVYSLNSEIVSAAQVDWLRSDLAANPSACVAAYWHHPRWATTDKNGSHGSSEFAEPLWDALADAGAELVINGHSHHYERLAPIRGMTEVVVGTGGVGLTDFGTPIAESLVRNSATHGVLKVTLLPGGFSAQFLPAGGGTFTDAFSASCH